MKGLFFKNSLEISIVELHLDMSVMRLGKLITRIVNKYDGTDDDYVKGVVGIAMGEEVRFAGNILLEEDC